MTIHEENKTKEPHVDKRCTHLMWSELRGVDEHRPHHNIAFPPRSTEEVQVAFVQGAHGRHEPHRRVVWEAPVELIACVARFAGACVHAHDERQFITYRRQIK